jgi:hypothetical protein
VTVLDKFEYEDEGYIITPVIIEFRAELRKAIGEWAGIKD